jgi:thiol-disulfide isomerase/thioredoxin
MKHILKIILIAILLFFSFGYKVNAEEKVDVYLFYSDTCPHCAKEKEMLNELVEKNSNIVLHLHEIHSYDSYKLWEKMANELGTKPSLVPFTVIGNVYFRGYSEVNTKNEIINEINKRLYPNNEEEIENEPKEENEKDNYQLDVPIIGKIETKDLSLPLIAIIIGTLDGFNPCAMWVLLFLISILMGMKDKKKMWTLGLAFIITSALIYFLFMVAWLNVALFVGSLLWIRLLVAGVALVGGFINLKSGLKKDTGCEVVDDKKREKIFTRIKKFTSEKKFLLALGGIILLAISVNLIELLCSASLPVIFTKILALNELTSIEYYLYILLYIIFFMIDDILVFFIAMATLKLTGISTKYGKISHIIGGILMIVIGLLLIFNPGLLMFT